MPRKLSYYNSKEKATNEGKLIAACNYFKEVLDKREGISKEFSTRVHKIMSLMVTANRNKDLICNDEAKANI